MGPVVHIATSLVGAGIFYSVFGNVVSAVIFFASGVLVDLDHIYDYAREHSIKTFTVRRLLETCYEDNFQKIILVFHSYEFLFILWIVITILKLGIYWIAFALGMTVHLIIDQLTNNTFTFSYFLTYRWMKNFKMENIFIKKGDKG